MRLVEYQGALQVLDFANGHIELVLVKAIEGAALIGQSISQLQVHMPSVEAKIVAISRQGETLTPQSDTVIEVDDEVFFIAAKDNVREVISELRGIMTPCRNIMIAGGGNIGVGLAQALEDRYHVKIISRDNNVVADWLKNCKMQSSYMVMPLMKLYCLMKILRM